MPEDTAIVRAKFVSNCLNNISLDKTTIDLQRNLLCQPLNSVHTFLYRLP